MRQYDLWFAYPEQKCVVKANAVSPRRLNTIG
jgi:hypothetical protein